MTFHERIHRVEAALIRRALREADGSVTKAARLLGFEHHQSLSSLLETRHRDLRVRPKQIRHKTLMRPVRTKKHEGQWHKEAM